MFKVNSLALLLHLLFYERSNTLSLPVAHRHVIFEDFREKTRLTNSLLEFFKTASELSCALACGKNPLCRSLNFCTPWNCFLNSNDVFSIGTNSSWIQQDPNCNYRGILRNHAPECIEGPVTKDIQDDEDPGSCKINKKRVDQVWGPWEPMVTIHMTTEWKKYQERKLSIPSAHGGMVFPERGTIRYDSWLRLGYPAYGWDGANSYCQQIGGYLFHSLLGTKDQLDFFYNVFGDTSFWLGVFATESVEQNKWETIRGQSMDSNRIYWSEDGYPRLIMDHATHLSLSFCQETNERQYIENTDPRESHFPICDMLA